MNYIVSGLERSGTAMMMQILKNGGLPVAYDDSSRPADYHNPKGYYELEGGKVIRKLMDGTFPLSKYEGVFIKVTAYGLKFLPVGNYKIIYMLRNIDEILDSTEKMIGAIDRGKVGPLFDKLNRFCLDLMERRDDISYITLQYSNIINHPREEITRVAHFIGDSLINIDAAVKAVDPKLYRNIRDGQIVTGR